MDGFEACLLINDSLKLQKEIYNGHNLSRNSLIYALTSDFSDDMKIKLKQYPFKRHFTILNNDKEVKLILDDIKNLTSSTTLNKSSIKVE